jgi:hypothetical protein
VVNLGRVGAVVVASLAIFAVRAELLQRRQGGGKGTI